MTGFRQMFDLSGRVAVVSGGAGLLGKTFAAAFAEHGADLAIVDKNLEGAEALCRELESTYGRRARAYGTDITDEAAVEDLVKKVAAELGEIRILMNNAATKTADPAQFFEPVESFSMDAWREIMGVNLDAMFLLARTTGREMARAGRGSIIQIASIYGVVAPDQRIYEGSEYLGRAINTPAIYSASKAGVIGLSNYLATYWGHAGVRVNTLTPGGVGSGQNGEFHKRYAARVPLGRMAKAEELAGAAVFLASDASSYVTGQNIIVDGGLSTW